MGISKVVYGNRPLIDLTADTVRAEDLASGVSMATEAVWA